MVKEFFIHKIRNLYIKAYIFYFLNIKGQWFDDHFDGEGILQNVNKNTFLDEIDYTNLHTYIKQDYWVYYKGGFRNDVKVNLNSKINQHGYGILVFSNGDQFQGMFKNDQANGEGIYIIKNGQRINGIWNNFKL